MSRRRFSGDAVNRLYLFLFFVVGALAAQISLREISILSLEGIPLTIVLVSPLAVALVLSGSAVGVILIPLCSLWSGAVCGIITDELIRSGLPLMKTIITLLLSVSVFFVVSVRGMQFASVLCACLERQSNLFGTRYLRSFLLMAMAILLLGALIFCFY